MSATSSQDPGTRASATQSTGGGTHPAADLQGPLRPGELVVNRRGQQFRVIDDRSARTVKLRPMGGGKEVTAGRGTLQRVLQHEGPSADVDAPTAGAEGSASALDTAAPEEAIPEPSIDRGRGELRSRGGGGTAPGERSGESPAEPGGGAGAGPPKLSPAPAGDTSAQPPQKRAPGTAPGAVSASGPTTGNETLGTQDPLRTGEFVVDRRGQQFRVVDDRSAKSVTLRSVGGGKDVTAGRGTLQRVRLSQTPIETGDSRPTLTDRLLPAQNRAKRAARAWMKGYDVRSPIHTTSTTRNVEASGTRHVVDLATGRAARQHSFRGSSDGQITDEGARGGVLPRNAPPASPEKLAKLHTQAENRLATLKDRLVQSTGLQPSWRQGKTVVVNTTEFDGIARQDGTIELAAARLDEDTHGATLLHELFHTASEREHGALAELKGWEEGPVEQLQRLFREELLPTANLHGSAELYADEDAGNIYNRYIEALEEIRAETGLEGKEFYLELIRVPLRQRPQRARELVLRAQPNRRIELIKRLSVLNSRLSVDADKLRQSGRL